MPRLAVAVAIKHDGLVVFDQFGQDRTDRGFQLLRGGLGTEFLLKVGRDLVQRFGHDRVEDGVGPRNGLGGTHGPELELVAGEGKR